MDGSGSLLFTLSASTSENRKKWIMALFFVSILQERHSIE